MIALFAFLSLLFNAQILIAVSQHMPKDYNLNINLFKRTREVFDKDLKVYYLPSETEIAKSGHVKLPVKRIKAIDQIKSMAVRLEAEFDVLPLNYEYHPRKKATEYSQSSRARNKLEKMEDMRKNNPRKYVEYLTKNKNRRKKFVEQLKDDPNVKIRAKEYNKTKLKMFAYYDIKFEWELRMKWIIEELLKFINGKGIVKQRLLKAKKLAKHSH